MARGIRGGALCGKDVYKADRCGPLRSRQLAVRLARVTGTEATVWSGWFPGQQRPQFICARLGDGRELDATGIDRLVGLPDLSIKGTAAELELLRQPCSPVVQPGYVGAGHPWACVCGPLRTPARLAHLSRPPPPRPLHPELRGR